MPSCRGSSPARDRTLLQEIFPSQGSNPPLLQWQTGSLPLGHLGGRLYSLQHLLSILILDQYSFVLVAQVLNCAGVGWGWEGGERMSVGDGDVELRSCSSRGAN